jgi:ferredoxin-NADP reductase
MTLTERGLPPHLYGKSGRHDLAVSLVLTASEAVGRLTARLPTRRMSAQPRGGPREVVIAQRTLESVDGSVVSLVLCDPDGGALSSWWPGAHLDVHLPSGIMRTYSLCGDYRVREHYRIAVRRIADGGGGSVEVHGLPVGSRLTIRGPRNAFPLAPPGAGSSARRLHFVAGGIGITPILAMITLAESRGIDWSLEYTGRDANSLAFLDDLARYEDRVTVRTDDRFGVPGAAALLAGVEAGDAIYCCGPPPLLATVRTAVNRLPDTELHTERFSPAPVIGGAPFEVQLKDGSVLTVGAEQTMLDALRQVRPRVAYSCQQGFCGTCSASVLAGRPEHRDTILTEDQRAAGDVLICVSRAEQGSRLVLDL